MDSAPEAARHRRQVVAYTAPMGGFLVGLALVSLVKRTDGPFWLTAPEYWIYPLQTLCCAGLLLWYWREYELSRPARPWFALLVGGAVFLLWIAPQAFFGVGPRHIGFNPDVFAAQPGFYWATVIMRFVRLAVVVPLVEEIFWRGFLLRYLINERFETVRIGAFTWLSFIVVTIAFTFVHATADWPAALATGALYNLVAYRTKSLSSCVLAHAVTNLLLGLWIMRTGQWGFW